MAFQASVLILPNSLPQQIPIKQFGQQPCQTERSLLPRDCRKVVISKCAMKVSMSHFVGPEGLDKQISVVKEKLEKSLPESVKEIEWNRAADLLVERLLSLGQKTLKWSIVALFALSSLSDVALTISRSQELVMPFGLFVGCLMTDFFKEISRQVFPSSQQQGKGLNLKLIGMGCFFVLVKSLSRGNVFLLHLANGGFMQVLWLWRSQDESLRDEETSASEEVVEDKF